MEASWKRTLGNKQAHSSQETKGPEAFPRTMGSNQETETPESFHLKGDPGTLGNKQAHTSQETETPESFHFWTHLKGVPELWETNKHTQEDPSQESKTT